MINVDEETHKILKTYSALKGKSVMELMKEITKEMKEEMKEILSENEL